jgi:hypothetical protein
MSMATRQSTPAPAPPRAPAPLPVSDPAAGAAPGRAGTGRAGTGGQRPVSPTARDLWRRWRVPLALAAVIVLGGIVIALLQPGAAITGYLDPSGTDAVGAHAIADLLSDRGYSVTRETTPAAAESAARAPGRGGVTLVVTSPTLLTAGQLDGLARVQADLVLIGPGRAALAALAPRVGLVGPAPVLILAPGCGLNAARLAGTADMGGAQLNLQQPGTPGTPGRHRAAPARPALCYPTGGHPSLVRYITAGRVITVLGTGNALTNGSLAHLGNAALALNLLGSNSRIVWLVPSAGPGAGLPSSGQQSVLSLVPLPAYLVAIQLGIAAVLTALWRARRLGPLVPEPLPVVVRASETVEGHAGLYRSRRARGRAADALRAAMLARTLPALGLAPDAGPGELVAAFSARSGSGQARIEAMLFGPAPGDDAALVALADDLDALESEVRTH